MCKGALLLGLKPCMHQSIDRPIDSPAALAAPKTTTAAAPTAPTTAPAAAAPELDHDSFALAAVVVVVNCVGWVGGWINDSERECREGTR
jgi:hypothetical protein